jgi:hypothetical protein
VKATTARTGAGVLDRLDAVAAKVNPSAMRLLISLSGFTSDLERATANGNDVQLIDIHRLYHGT